MGSPSSSAAGSSGPNAEWMELKNVSQADVTLSGWSVEDATGKIMVRFGPDDRVTAGSLILLVRGSTTFPYAHVHEVPYTGTLPNTGDDVAILDPSCAISDFVGAEGGWPAGDNVSKETMERDASGAGWHTSALSGGTPGGENSVPGPATYPVQVSFEGSGGGSVTSAPAGLSCSGASCSGTFAAGSSVTLAAQAPAGSVFGGWSGACMSTGSCTFTVSGPLSAIASFIVPSSFNVATPVLDSVSSSTATAISTTTAAVAGTSSSPTASSSDPSSGTASDSGAPPHVLIAAVQIAGAQASNDYVKLYNGGSTAADIGGWKLRKRSQSGTEYSLRTFPQESIIPARAYFVWANSEDGFAASLGADASSTGTLAADNSVAILDADGNVIDALAWGTGTGQYAEGNPFPTDPAAGQTLVRNKSGGDFMDTRDNATDFSLQ